MTKTSVSFCYRVHRHRLVFSAVAFICLVAGVCAFSATDPWNRQQVIEPSTLAEKLQGSGDKPLLLQVGFESLYRQGHIPGSKYCGPASNSAGIARLKACVENVPHEQPIVLYCGCCPWQECPNIRPAFNTLKAMGFSHVEVVRMASNFGKDWAHHGYPVSTGR